MNSISNCNTSTLEIYVPSEENRWNMQKASHLYRRAAFGAKPEKLNEILLKTPQEAIDDMFEESLALALPEGPDWRFTLESPYSNNALREFLQIWMAEDLLTNDLRYRLVLFWTNHFVIETDVVGTPKAGAQYYYDVIIPNSLGNFKTFVREIGINAGMLRYLNGDTNIADAPNENYARELYELFTLGVDNGYTQEDIEETARALTGWNSFDSSTQFFSFDPERFDDGEKTIFGETDNWGYDDVINILFEKHSDEVAKFICTKFYKYFISPEVNTTIVDGLAATFLENDFEIIPVLKQLFKSAHFFDPATEGVIIKSPIDLHVCFASELDGFTRYNDGVAARTLVTNGQNTGQTILNPPDVSGWSGDINWISSNNLVLRWEFVKKHISETYNFRTDPYVTFAKDLMIEDTSDVALVSSSIMNFFIPKPLLVEEDYQEGLSYFTIDVPSNYIEEGIWNLEYEGLQAQVRSLLDYLVTLPEFQLK